MKEHRFGEAVVSSQQNHDIEEQETGVELVSKLLHIVSIANYTQGSQHQGRALFYALNHHEDRHFSLRRRQGSISMGRRYQLTNSTPPWR
jgi:hypothetical protein